MLRFRLGSTSFSFRILGCAMRVQRVLGRGLLEGGYHACLRHELERDGLHVESEVVLPVVYEGIRIERGYRIDLVVAAERPTAALNAAPEQTVLVEVKAVRALTDAMKAQLLTYMKLYGSRLGLLVNFNAPTIRDGTKRVIH